MQVQFVRTKLTAAQALGVIQQALGQNASDAALRMVGAQSSVETAGWQSMANWNFGNITVHDPNTSNWMYQGSNPRHFAAYPDPLTGASAMIRWLSNTGLLPYALAGDLDGYAIKLAKAGYLGYIGLTDASGHTVTQTDYDQYKAGIAAQMAKLAGVSPVSLPDNLVSGIQSIPAAGMTTAQAVGVGAFIVASAGTIAYLMPARKPVRRIGRRRFA